MSVAGIASSIFSQIATSQNSKRTAAQTEFQQLGQDLQAGNLTQAQSDFAALQQTTPASSGSSAISQAFSALGQDIQTGNLTGAQQELATIKQDFQQAAQSGQFHHHHHSAEPQTSNSTSTQSTNSISQLFATLGQDLQTGNLTAAQQAYTSLQQDSQLFAGSAAAAVSAPFQASA